MSKRLLWLPALAVLLLAGRPAPAAAPPAAPKKTTAREAQALAEKIDAHFARRWAERGVKPAPLADDAEFLRRVYLDLGGRIPSVEEARTFLRDRRSDKRARLV